MQLVVLGMHRSGTSAVTRLLNLSGAYFGAPDAGIPAKEENPEGFWERRDVRAVCDGVLHGAGADWWRIKDFRLDQVPEGVVEANRAAFSDILRNDLDQHEPWVVKEPRLCLLLPLFRPLLQRPVVVVVHRDPLEIARSVSARNGVPLSAGVALWEVYIRSALAASADVPRVLVRHADVISDPQATIERLVQDLQAAGVAGLTVPPPAAIGEFLRPDLYRHRATKSQRSDFLNPAQLELAAALDEGRLPATSGWEDVTEGARESLWLFERAWADRARRRTLKEQRRSLRQQLDRKDAVIDGFRSRADELTLQMESLREAAHRAERSAAKAQARAEELERSLRTAQRRYRNLRRRRSVRAAMKLSAAVRRILPGR